MRDETGSAIQARLLQAMGHADYEVLPGHYAFERLAAGDKPRDDALTCVRDGETWSQLVPVEAVTDGMVFRIFAFHFDPRYDAAGFVGWLHAHLARATGVGHIVVMLDYWGCPAEDADRVLAEIERLRERGRRPQRAHVGPQGGCLLCEGVSWARFRATRRFNPPCP